ncbi:MAG: triose-phosphate isomerase [Fibromonadaceae bacterium]|jgi:triosephosphate isomerase|nr:triose-phosphate isomerase [Fibromonadaceae bacterium]
MRKYIIAGNWKMNKTVAESVALAKEIVEKTKGISKTEVVIAPTYLAAAKVADIVNGSNVKLAVQDIHWENQGAFTGKVSVDMVKEIGVEYIIIGHSEQRQFFHETDATVNLKAKKVLSAGLKPIICIGETLGERNGGKLESVLTTQVEGAYKDISESDALKTVIAYEPVWAIGTDVVATDEQAQEAQKYVRSLVAKLYGESVAEALRIQYGGSMKPDNAVGLLSQKDIDGGLIGGAALKADSFFSIIDAAEKAER